jgi:hypothetical protein
MDLLSLAYDTNFLRFQTNIQDYIIDLLYFLQRPTQALKTSCSLPDEPGSRDFNLNITMHLFYTQVMSTIEFR